MARPSRLRMDVALHPACGPYSSAMRMLSEAPANIHEETMQSVRFCAAVDSPFYSHRHTGLHSSRLLVTFWQSKKLYQMKLLMLKPLMATIWG